MIFTASPVMLSNYNSLVGMYGDIWECHETCW